MEIFFYCNAVTDDLRQERRLVGSSPAATRKVIGLCHACRSAGIDAKIVSMGRGKVGSFSIFLAKTQDIQGIPTWVGPMVNIPLVSYIVSILWLAWAAWRLSDGRKVQIHLFYNQLTFYLLALLVLRLLGQRTAVDIEDGAITTKTFERSLGRARFGSNASPAIFAKFISHGALLANSALASGTTIQPVMPYYGAIAPRLQRALSDEVSLRILMSGTLEKGTGTDLLTEALLLVDESELANRVIVNITGTGSGLAELRALSKSLKRVQLNLHGMLDRCKYEELIAHSDVGLSLKLKGLMYSDTTFPSKTIEYAENGLLVITTDISDVRAVFADTAWYLTDNDSHLLAGLLLKAAADPVAARLWGQQGQKLVINRFTTEKAGEQLRTFFFGECS